MRVVVTRAAQADIRAALDWYDQHASGAGFRFLAEFSELSVRLAQNPRQFPIVHPNTRRVKFRRFPYALYFRVQGEEVQVFACFHSSRNPRHWQDRTQ